MKINWIWLIQLREQISQVIYKGFESEGELIMREKLYQLFNKEDSNESN